MYRARARLVLVTLILLLPAVGASQAQSFDENGFLLEVYAGQVLPSSDLIDDETALGLRFGYVAGSRLTIVGSAGFVTFDGTYELPGPSADFEIDSWLIDVTASYIFLPEKKINLGLGGGIGAALSDVTANASEDLIAPVTALGEDSLTVNVTADLVIQLTGLLYLKPAYRLRWYESRDDDETESEVSLALGFKF